jgi:hypothetical protein
MTDKVFQRRKPDDEDYVDERTHLIDYTPSNSIAAQQIMGLIPDMYGHCMLKKSSFIKDWLLCCCGESWRRRYLILFGDFLYRFEDEYGDHPKGIPIPLDSCIVNLAGRGFTISTIRKAYHFKVELLSDAENWVSSITLRQQEIIKEKMGHRQRSKNILRTNTIGMTLYNEKMLKDTYSSQRGNQSNSFIPSEIHPQSWDGGREGW